MIRINDDWIVDVDDNNYILKKDLHCVRIRKNKDGTFTEGNGYSTIGYFSTLDKALDRLGEEMVRNGLKDASHTLETAVQTIRECRNEWRKLTKKILEGNE